MCLRNEHPILFLILDQSSLLRQESVVYSSDLFCFSFAIFKHYTLYILEQEWDVQKQDYEQFIARLRQEIGNRRELSPKVWNSCDIYLSLLTKIMA